MGSLERVGVITFNIGVVINIFTVWYLLAYWISGNILEIAICEIMQMLIKVDNLLS